MFFSEYGTGGEVSMRGDVYSFGILLLEMFTGKRPTDSMFNDGLTLHEFAKRALPEEVVNIVEPSLLTEEIARNSDGEIRVRTEQCLSAVIGIGVSCSMESPTERMETRDAVAKLCAARETFHGNRISYVRGGKTKKREKKNFVSLDMFLVYYNCWLTKVI